MKFFYKWINKWENNYIEKKLKELDEHPERNKTSSGILQETLIFLFFAIFFGCIIEYSTHSEPLCPPLRATCSIV